MVISYLFLFVSSKTAALLNMIKHVCPTAGTHKRCLIPNGLNNINLQLTQTRVGLIMKELILIEHHLLLQ